MTSKACRASPMCSCVYVLDLIRNQVCACGAADTQGMLCCYQQVSVRVLLHCGAVPAQSLLHSYDLSGTRPDSTAVPLLPGKRAA